MNPPADPPVIAIIGAGEMGVAVGRRLREAGARVVISLDGRSAASADRVRRAGLEVVHDDQRLTDGIDFILSIVPPATALEVAERLRTPLRNAASPPPFADCNAISPATMRRVERLLDPLVVIDAGIIGGPPLPGSQDPAAGPRFYTSGPHAHRLAALTHYGGGSDGHNPKRNGPRRPEQPVEGPQGKMSKPRDEATAYHEAGHVIVAIDQGLRIQRASIVPEAGSHGQVTAPGLLRPVSGVLLNQEFVTPQKRDRLERVIRLSLAGDIAQRKFNPRSCRRYHTHDDYQDAVGLVDLLCKCPEEVDAYVKLLDVQTRALIELHWFGVKAVAKALLEHRTLARAELQQVYDDAFKAEIVQPESPAA